MNEQCPECSGKGFQVETTVCPDCKGQGSNEVVIGIGESKGDDCPTCDGKGKLEDKTKCKNCNGDGILSYCSVCSGELENEEDELCPNCQDNPVIIQLAQPLDKKYLDGKRALAAKVINVDGRGALVDLGAGFKGTFKPKGEYYKEGSTVPVRLKYPLDPQNRGGKPTPVEPLQLDDYKVVKKHLPVDEMVISEINEEVGNVGKLTVQVTDIFVIPNGPTLFTVIDSSGDTIQASAYGEGNRQAYPSIYPNTVVKIIGRFRYYNDQERIQIYSLEKANASEAIEFMDQLASVNQETREKIEAQDFFVGSEVYQKLKDQFISAANRIRSAVLRNQNIILRYHSPCVDGTAGAYALDFAIRRYYSTRGTRPDDFKKNIRRMPHRSPIFGISDVSRDLSFSLEDYGNYHSLPLYILVDCGSSKDSKAAIQMCNSYGADVIVIDHHVLADGIEEEAHSLINPNLVSDEAMINSGMLAVELAKFVAVENDLENQITHLGAIAGYSDKLEGMEYDAYLELASENEFDIERIDNIKYALEYVTFGMRHIDGGEIIRNILGLTGPLQRNAELLESITPEAKALFNQSLGIMSDNAAHSTLDNGLDIYEVDLENYVPRYDYPPHSELMFEFHMDKVEQSEEPIVTLGISQAYIIVRNSSLEFSFSNFVEKLKAEAPELSITGSGHNRFGSIQFYQGHQEEVLETIKSVLAE